MSLGDNFDPALLRAFMSSEVEDYDYVRSKEQILKGEVPVGFIVSPTSTKVCNFAVFDYADEYVYEGQLLTIRHGGVKVIGLVTGLNAATRGATTDVLNYFSSIYGEIPQLEQNLKYGELRIYGKPVGPGVASIAHPPKPCSPVYVASKEDYRLLFKDPSREDEYFEIGRIRETDYSVEVDASAILRLGVGIFARIGMGKSVTAASFLVGLSSLSKKINVLVWDHTGEYATGNLGELCSRFEVLQSSDLPVVPTDSGDLVKLLMLDVLPSQARKAVEVAADLFMMDFLAGEVGLDSSVFMNYVNDWLKEFYSKDQSSRTWSVAIEKRIKMLGSCFFNGSSIDDYSKVWKLAANRILVIDASQDPLEARQAKLGTIADLILKKRLPIHLVIDEAKNYIPETGGAYSQVIVGKPFLCLGKITSLSEEGRKFGANLTIVNQRISRISKAVFSNLCTLFCGCLTAASDMSAIEGYTDFPEIKGILPRLGVGEFLVAGMATPIREPVCVSIDKGDIRLGYGRKTVFELHEEFAEGVARLEPS
ncbi:MAG: ATP-binding protein [Candidatus Jordarchaeales archaeon]